MHPTTQPTVPSDEFRLSFGSLRLSNRRNEMRWIIWRTHKSSEGSDFVGIWIIESRGLREDWIVGRKFKPKSFPKSRAWQVAVGCAGFGSIARSTSSRRAERFVLRLCETISRTPNVTIVFVLGQVIRLHQRSCSNQSRPEMISMTIGVSCIKSALHPYFCPAHSFTQNPLQHTLPAITIINAHVVCCALCVPRSLNPIYSFGFSVPKKAKFPVSHSGSARGQIAWSYWPRYASMCLAFYYRAVDVPRYNPPYTSVCTWEEKWVNIYMLHASCRLPSVRFLY